jgi:hypothetical protein
MESNFLGCEVLTAETINTVVAGVFWTVTPMILRQPVVLEDLSPPSAG